MYLTGYLHIYCARNEFGMCNFKIGALIACTDVSYLLPCPLVPVCLLAAPQSPPSTIQRSKGEQLMGAFTGFLERPHRSLNVGTFYLLLEIKRNEHRSHRGAKGNLLKQSYAKVMLTYSSRVFLNSPYPRLSLRAVMYEP